MSSSRPVVEYQVEVQSVHIFITKYVSLLRIPDAHKDGEEAMDDDGIYKCPIVSVVAFRYYFLFLCVETRPRWRIVAS